MSTPSRIPAWHVASLATAGLACALQAGWATTDPPVANPLGNGESVTLEPAAPPANTHRQRAVFVCQEGGVPVYADRPCGSTVATRSVVIDAPRPGAAATTSPPTPRASVRPQPAPYRPATGPAAATEAKCRTLQRQVDELNDRMRAGYSAREAARLWQRWRDAKERLRQARC
jgi:hypothetical protein